MIGIFDSGFGGLTVLKQLLHVLPHEQFLYLGDTARFPYGSKSQETITSYALQNCTFLSAQGVKCIVIACNTATALALPNVQSRFSIPIIGVIEPVISHLSPHGHIGILGTHATIASRLHQTLLPLAQITAVPAPLLVNLVEEGLIDHPITHLTLQHYLHSLQNIDTLVLACTHFPLLQPHITKLLPSVHIIDPAIPCAQATLNILSNLNLLSKETSHPEPLFYVTDCPAKFQEIGARFLGREISGVQLVQLAVRLGQPAQL